MDQEIGDHTGDEAWEFRAAAQVQGIRVPKTPDLGTAQASRPCGAGGKEEGPAGRRWAQSVPHPQPAGLAKFTQRLTRKRR